MNGRPSGSPDVGAVIRPSDGVSVVPFEDGFVAYDAVEELAHVLGPAGLFAMTEGSTSIQEIVGELLAVMDHIDPDEATTFVAHAVDELRSLELIDRVEPFSPPDPWSGSTRPIDEVADWAAGRAHQVADVTVTFRSPDSDLLSRVDRCMQPNQATCLPAAIGGDRGISRSVFIDVEPVDGGGVRVDARVRWDFPSEAQFFRQILGFLNEYAAHASSCATLHAGAVRTPDGRLLVFPGEIDSGKSTLTAALVMAGCDYISDESVGLLRESLYITSYVKPLALSAESRKLLGLAAESNGTTSVTELRSDAVLLEGAVGRPTAIVLPRYRRRAKLRFEHLGTQEALRELMANTHNLGRSGVVGLAAVARAAGVIPVTRLTHGDAVSAASAITHGCWLGQPASWMKGATG